MKFLDVIACKPRSVRSVWPVVIFDALQDIYFTLTPCQIWHQLVYSEGDGDGDEAQPRQTYCACRIFS